MDDPRVLKVVLYKVIPSSNVDFPKSVISKKKNLFVNVSESEFILVKFEGMKASRYVVVVIQIHPEILIIPQLTHKICNLQKFVYPKIEENNWTEINALQKNGLCLQLKRNYSFTNFIFQIVI